MVASGPSSNYDEADFNHGLLARIRELGDFPDSTIRSAIVAFLSRPGSAQNLDGARLMLDMMLDEGIVRTRDPSGSRPADRPPPC